jgi:autotransporter-associated beta strand protein
MRRASPRPSPSKWFSAPPGGAGHERRDVGRVAPLLLVALVASHGPWPLEARGQDRLAETEPALRLEANPWPFFTAIGSATSQGVSVLQADQARAIFGVTGAGVKLGVISDSFNGSGSAPTVATQIAAGNLPGTGNPHGYTTGVSIVKDGSGTDEGRAVLEIVHDVAPGAALYFHSAFNNTQTPGYTNVDTAAPDQTIADAIDGLAAVPGMRIIVDDVGILTAPRFQDGAAAQAANAAFASGIAYFSAAGNSATDATRVTTSAGVNGTVNWGSDDLLRMRIDGNSTGLVALHWGEPYPSVSGPAATSNFIVAATSVNGATTFFTVDNQWADEDPYEFFSISYSGSTAIDFALQVTRLSGTAPVVMQLSTFRSTLAITDVDKTNAPTIHGHAAATGAVAVAASFWGTPASVESFSSRGPTTILFDAAGNAVVETRATPQLTAPDGGTTTTAGFSSFFGTSAAAPHAAAVAALVLERFDQQGVVVSTRDLYQVLYESAVDIDAPGFDTASGHGRIDALAAVSAGRIWDGNGATTGVSGTGSWSQAKWTLEASGDKPTGRFIRGQQAIFGSGTAPPASSAVTVDGDYDVAGLQFARDTVTLAAGGGTLRLTSPVVDVGSGLTATLGAVLSGSVGLTKTGDGRLLFAAPNAFTGPTTVVSGTLAGSAASLPVAITNDAHVEFDQPAFGSYAGVIGGSGAVIVRGAGELILAGSHTFTGSLTVDGGRLATAGAERLSDSTTVTVTGTSASWRLGGDESIAAVSGNGLIDLQTHRLTLTGDGDETFAGRISGFGGLAKTGAGILTLSGSNDFLGATTVTGGTVTLATPWALSPRTMLSIGAGATVVLTEDVRVFSWTNAGTVTGPGTLLTSATTASGGTLAASLDDVGGVGGYAVGLLKTSTDTLVVSVSNGFTGGIVVDQGTVRLEGGGFAAGNVLDVRSGGQLDLNGSSQSFSALAGSGSVSLGGGTLTIDATQTTIFDGSMAGGSLVKTGPGGLVLGGSAAMTSASIDAGRLSIDGTLSGTVTVAPGGVLGGSGILNGPVAIAGSHAPGNSPGVQTVNGDLDYQSGSSLTWELAANTATQGAPGSYAFDQVIVGGNLTFSGSTSLILSFYDTDPESDWASAVDWSEPFWGRNRSWTLWDVSGMTTGFESLSLVVENWLDATGGGGQSLSAARSGSSFSLQMPEGSGDVLLVYVVPEPATIVLAGIAAALTAWTHRRARSRR